MWVRAESQAFLCGTQESPGWPVTGVVLGWGQEVIDAPGKEVHKGCSECQLGMTPGLPGACGDAPAERARAERLDKRPV